MLRCVNNCWQGYRKFLRGLEILSHFTVYTDPWIACPIDRVEELEPDKSTVVLGYKWQLPRTNMKTVTVSPSNYDENYAFPVGNHRVTWMGTSDSGTQISCSFHITVNGKMLLLSYDLVLKDGYGSMTDQRRVSSFLLRKQDNLETSCIKSNIQI